MDQGSEASRLTAELVALRQREQVVAGKLRKLVTIVDVLEALPCERVYDRYKALGISKQSYYNLRQGIAKPDAKLIERLAKLTGYPAEMVRTIYADR